MVRGVKSRLVEKALAIIHGKKLTPGLKRW